MRFKWYRFVAIGWVSSVLAGAVCGDALESGFCNPPLPAKPRVWWDWMNGNISREGIIADLEAMQRVGIGGATIFNVRCAIPKGQVTFASPEWFDLVRVAMTEADRLGLELGLHNCAGWSGSGGPWIPPEESMKMLTWSEARIRGGQEVKRVLAEPFSRCDYYDDISVFAFPEPDGDMQSPAARLFTGTGESGSAANDGSWDTGVSLGVPADAPVTLTAVFEQPFEARSMTLVARRWQVLSGELQVSSDGETFRKVRDISVPHHAVVQYPFCVTFPAVTGRYFRLVIREVRGESPNAMVCEFNLMGGNRIENFYGKACFGAVNPEGNNSGISEKDCIPFQAVIDLTDRVDETGTLRWSAPEGDWVVVRMGCTTTGMKGRTPPEGADGLRCDVLSKKSLDLHWEHMIEPLLDEKAFKFIEIDSWEIGIQNWTEKFREEFAARRGYDLAGYWPALTGRVVGNEQDTEQFLTDVRRTVSDLIADNYYSCFSERCAEHGLKLYAETYGGYAAGGFNELECSGRVDIPMTEFWLHAAPVPSGHDPVAVSSAHIYGRPIVAAESFTADCKNTSVRCWADDPFSMKALTDNNAFCGGINQLVFHSFPHNPWPQYQPGMTMGLYGTALGGTETWWEPGRAWIDYLSRCQFLLQQGRFVADTCFYLGDDGVPVDKKLSLIPALPKGFARDFCTDDAVLQMQVRNNMLYLPAGMSYRYLVLSDPDAMTDEVRSKVCDLVTAGATVVDPHSALGQVHSLNGGRVLPVQQLEHVFKADDICPDFSWKSQTASSVLNYIHRRTNHAEIYFVANPLTVAFDAECRFRISGCQPEVWHPDSGLIEPVSAWREEGSQTIVNLHFEKSDSMFVVFRGAAPSRHVVDFSFDPAVPGEDSGMSVSILKAQYGVDGAQVIDVTRQVETLVKNGESAILVNNRLAGIDPAPNVLKELVVEWELRGERHCSRVREGQMFVISGGTHENDGLPDAALSADSDRGLEIRAMKNGVAAIKMSDGRSRSVEIKEVPPAVNLSTEWTVNFPVKNSAAISRDMEKLVSWTTYSLPELKYFSGTAVYQKTFESGVPRSDQRVFLDLGEVKNLAAVTLNGRSLGVLWKPPFCVEITDQLRHGTNELEIRVTNLWPNRLIGDEQLPAVCEWNANGGIKSWPSWVQNGEPVPEGRVSFTTWRHWSKDDQLLPSGLLGPVRLRVAKVLTLAE